MSIRVAGGRFAVALAVALAVAAGLPLTAGLVAAHAPDPPMSWPLFTAGDTVEFRWMANEVPPLKMRDAVVAAAAGAAASSGSRAPSLAYAADGESTVEYGASVFCGVNGLACADGWHAPDHFHVAFRTHGHAFDWGTLRWCQLLASISNGCFDVENVALDEIGHVLGLGHHVNFADDSDYTDAVVQTVSRARPKAGWDTDEFAPCDVAKLQLRYDMVNSARKYSSCLDLATSLSLGISDTSIWLGETVTFTAVVRVADTAGYERLRANFLSERPVVLQRRLPGTSSWTTIATMPAVGTGTYEVRISPTATYEWRGLFSKPAAEGLRASSSAPKQVTVGGGCSSGPCPQSPIRSIQQEARR